jgi:hypothetical protein
MKNLKKFLYNKKTFFCIKAFVKMLFFTFVFFKLNFSLEISLILAVISVIIMEKVITKELFELSTSCNPELPTIDLKSDNDHKAVVQVGFANLFNGKCVPTNPYTLEFFEDIYVNQENTKFRKIPSTLLQLHRLSENTHTSMRLTILKGYEMIITNNSDNKISFGSPENDIVIENLNQLMDAFKNLKFIEVNEL